MLKTWVLHSPGKKHKCYMLWWNNFSKKTEGKRGQIKYERKFGNRRAEWKRRETGRVRVSECTHANTKKGPIPVAIRNEALGIFRQHENRD